MADAKTVEKYLLHYSKELQDIKAIKAKKIIKGSKVKTPQGPGKVWAVERFPEDNLTIIVVELDSEPGIAYEFSPSEVERFDIKKPKPEKQEVSIQSALEQSIKNAYEEKYMQIQAESIKILQDATISLTSNQDLTDWKEWETLCKKRDNED